MLNSYPWLILLVLLLLVVNVVLLVLIWRHSTGVQPSQQQSLLDTMAQNNTHLETELRRAMDDIARNSRQEQTQALAELQRGVVQQNAESIRNQVQQLQGLQAGMVSMHKQVTDTLNTQLSSMYDSNAKRLNEIRNTLQEHMAQLQSSNTEKLDEMRKTVDEKLQATLQTRLTESFRQVAERLEMVHRGLGEMQNLAQGVGDLKQLLSNVKVRGIFGETQLGALLEQALSHEQYASQIQVHPHSKHAVDFAIRLPGKNDGDKPVWLPIDAKFPTEDYERLLEAQQKADSNAVEAAAKQLESHIKLEAKSIAERYISPPYTTDFAVLFLPTEGLYAETIRRPGLIETLQRTHRVTLAGPTTLLVMLNALQMGFRTLALEKRSSEVWQVLGAVKTEFEKFGTVLNKVRSQTQTVLRTLDQVDTRNRVMQKALRSAEALPDLNAQELFDNSEYIEGISNKDNTA